MSFELVTHSAGGGGRAKGRARRMQAVSVCNSFELYATNRKIMFIGGGRSCYNLSVVAAIVHAIHTCAMLARFLAYSGVLRAFAEYCKLKLVVITML